MSQSPSFAVYAQGDAYSTAGKIMGRQAAGEGFLRGVVRTWPQGNIHLVDGGGFGREGLDQNLRSEGFSGSVSWSTVPEFAGARATGALYFPAPPSAHLARFRNRITPAAYSIIGVTHSVK